MSRRLFVCLLASFCIPATILGQDREVRALASSLAETLGKSPKKTVAVVDFTDLQGNVTELGRFLAEELSVALAINDRGMDVVDRTHLKALLQEHKLAATGVIDPSTARRLGEIAGVQVLVTGTVTPFGDSVRVSIKALDTVSAKIAAASTMDVPRTKAVEELLSRSVQVGASPNMVGPASLTQNTTRAGETRRVGQLEVTFNGCHSQPEGVLCEALVKNLGQERQYCLYTVDGDVMSRIVDDHGNVYVPSIARLAEKNVSGMVIVCANLPNGVPVISGLLFDRYSVDQGNPLANMFRQRPKTQGSPPPGEGARLVLVEFRFDIERSYAGRTSMSFQFRNVSVTR